MVSVYGDQKEGHRGPRGFPGNDSTISDFCTWLPNAILNQMQEHEQASYLLDPENPEKDLKRGENKTIIEWKSRNVQKGNLIAVHPSSNVEETPDGQYAMSFDNNLYHAQISFVEAVQSYGYLCITFKVDGDDDDEQVLITNYRTRDPVRQFHEISVTSNGIDIYGYLQNKLTHVPIQHNCRNWTTLFLDYTTHEPDSTSEFTYILNNDPKMQGNFTFQCPRASQPGVYVGSRKDGTKPFVGSVHALEMYNTQIPKPIPQTLKRLIIKTQQIDTNKGRRIKRRRSHSPHSLSESNNRTTQVCP